jgi:hypothetical protein
MLQIAKPGGKLFEAAIERRKLAHPALQAKQNLRV